MQKNTFDRESLKRLGVDATILFGPQILLYVLDALKTFDFGNYTELAGLVISAVYYMTKRYMQGEKIT